MEFLRQVYSAHPQPLPYALPRLDVAWREGIQAQGCHAKKLKVRSTAFGYLSPYGCFSVWILAPGTNPRVSDDKPINLSWAAQATEVLRLTHRDYERLADQTTRSFLLHGESMVHIRFTQHIKDRSREVTQKAPPFISTLKPSARLGMRRKGLWSEMSSMQNYVCLMHT